jgi:hypothetical protein
MNEFIDISDYFILPHCRRRWKKRWLEYTPKGEKRIKNVDEIIKERMRIIKVYPEQQTYRVTDGRYEFVVDPGMKTIITMNACKKEKNYLTKKYHRRNMEDGEFDESFR